MPCDSILLCGFGGPQPGCCGRRDHCDSSRDCFEADCFVQKILGDDPSQSARVAEVVAHYRHFGGLSPYNEKTEHQRQALQDALAAAGHPLPVAVGYRNWPPWYRDGWQALRAAGCQHTLLVVMAPHQGKRSWDDYLSEATAARAAVTDAPLIIGHTAPIYEHPNFISALIDRAHQALGGACPAEECALLLTAHAIPQPAERGRYRPQVERTASLVAADAGFAATRLGFQSAPSDSRIPWSQPLMEDALGELAGEGFRQVVALPIGFLVDHMEVLFDLDVELAEHARRQQVSLYRARTVEDHPLFINALLQQILPLLNDPTAAHQ